MSCAFHRTSLQRIRGLYIAACFAVLAAVLPVPARAMYNAEVVRVGYYENEVFQEGAQVDAVKTGYAYEYYLKISEYTGWRYEYVYGEFGELYQMLLDGEIDCMAGLAWTEERAGLIGYPDLAMGSETYSLVRHDTDADITNAPSTLSGKRIGVLNSAMVPVLNHYLASHEIKADVMTFSDYEALFAAFDEKKVDVLAAEGDGAYGRNHAEVLCTFGSSDYFLCVAAGRGDLLDELNAAQAELQVYEPNYIGSLRLKYYSASVSSRAFSSAETEWLNSHSVMRIGYLKHYLPYSDTDERGEPTGIVQEIVPKLLEELGIGGIDVSYQGFESYNDMIAAVSEERVDAVFPVGGGLYYSEENGIYQSNAVVSSSTDLVFKGEYHEETASHFASNENNRMQYYYIRTNFPEAEITLYPSIEACLDAVRTGKVGCTTLNGLRANDILKNSKYSELNLQQLSRNDDRCFGVKIGNDGLLKLLNRGVNVLGSEYAQNLAYRYTDGLYAYTAADLLKDYAGWVIAAVLAVIALVIVFLARDSRRVKKSQTELSAALLAAEQANRAKSDFLSNMSHEIRTPITAILGMNEMIQRESRSEDVLTYSDNIQKAGTSLLGIISDILDFSKIEAGRMEIDSAPYMLSALIGDSLNLTRLRAEGKGLALQTEIDPNLPEHLIGDEIRVKQVITNLLSNAVKYTEKGSVKLKCELWDRVNDAVDIRISVQDTGIGIRREEIDKLFSAFDRLDATRTRTIEGTGLGLTITNRLLSMMDSSLEVDSVYGSGSTFSFVLKQNVAEWTPIGEFTPPSRAAGKNHKKSRSPFVAPDARILVVDDTPMNLQVICGLLKRTKMRIDCANSGRACVEQFGMEDYDLVFLDYRMPEMDGIETLARIMELYPEKTARTPIICLTASAVAGEREHMLSAGFTDYLTKPVSIEDMEAMLVKYLPVGKVNLTEAEGEDADDSEAVLPRGLAEIPQLDIERGVGFCGGYREYLDALMIFEASIEDRAREIVRCAADEDWTAYTIAVHSLKSTARAVGAIDVSDLAKSLEEAGNRGDVDTVLRDTPLLLAAYRGLREPLERVFRERDGAEAKPPLPEQEFDDALSAIHELCALYDDSSIQDILSELEGRMITDSREALYRKLCDAAARVDWEELSKLTESK